jgi:hypothetical protein
MVRKALLRNNQASSTEGYLSRIPGPGRLKVCSLKCFRERLTVVGGWLFDRRPITDAGNEAVIAEIWLKTAEVYLESKLVRMI